MFTLRLAYFRKFSKYSLLLAGITAFVTLLLRNTGIHPAVPDEYIYSELSRLLPLADANVPSFLYLAIYRTTNFCGDGFLGCAKILNASFFLAGVYLVYLTARQLCTHRVAETVALLTLLGPFNIYTAFYMPESLYFLSFWLFTWFLLRLDHSSNAQLWCFAGILLGLTALVKPHAAFLIPAVLLYIVFLHKNAGARPIFGLLKAGSLFVAFFALTKFVIGYLFAEKAGLTLFGRTYNSIAGSGTLNIQYYLELLTLVRVSVQGHVLAISLIFGLPIAYVINTSLTTLIKKVEIGAIQKISFYTLMVLISLLLVTSIFTASVAGSGVESIVRLHMRYYNFALPLLVIISAAQLSDESPNSTTAWRAGTAFPIGAVILVAIYTHLSPYTPWLVDSPELRGFTSNPVIFSVLSTFSLFALALWVFSAKSGVRVFFYIFIPATVVISSYYINRELVQHLVPNTYAKAGIFAKQYLSNDDLSKLVIVGSDPSSLYLTSIYLDNRYVTRINIPTDEVYDLSSVPSDKEWALVIGNKLSARNLVVQISRDGFTLARSSASRTVDFKKTEWPGVISGMKGLSKPEPWGTWSLGSTLTLEFSLPLPEKFRLHLTAFAFGPNVGKEFVAHVGGSAVKFKLSGFPPAGAQPEEQVFEFFNPNGSNTITFDIPLPTSPKALGISDDPRNLGIALHEVLVRGF